MLKVERQYVEGLAIDLVKCLANTQICLTDILNGPTLSLPETVELLQAAIRQAWEVQEKVEEARGQLAELDA